MELRTEHYDQTIANFSALGSGDLHFVGYHETDRDSLVDALTNMNRLIGRCLSPKPESQILDVGCGTGGPAIFLAKDFGCHVTGVDLGSSQIQAAEQAARKQGLADRTSFLVADGTQLPFADATFDGIYLLGSASHVADKSRLFSEAARVVKEHGTLVFADIVAPSADWQTNRQYSRIRRMINAFFENPHLLSAGEYQDELSRSGFQIRDVLDLNSHVARSAELWRRALAEDEERLCRDLGRSQWEALSRAIQVFGEAAQEGHFGAIVVTAHR